MKFVNAQGVEIPAIGIGTARFDSNNRCREAVETALRVGYRHIDTAQMYGTEGAVGEAVATANVNRKDLFITTKLDTGNRDYDSVINSTHESLEALQLETADLLLIHSPNDTVALEETIDAMNELQDQGAVDHIGVSNFSVGQLRDAIELSETPIVANQVEYHPYMDQSELLKACVNENVTLTAYSPLDVGGVLDDPTLKGIGDQYGKTSSQVSLRWLLQQEMVSTVPKSADEEHIRENFDVFDFELTDEEMGDIFAIAE
ncbi:aldo/keto reductase [Halobium palmae]|uniref:Aldo/keto reductase n=1 Tax=Halobium palmae TaxID=1776492 RepID=A0ABD5RV63_9EURY